MNESVTSGSYLPCLKGTVLVMRLWSPVGNMCTVQIAYKELKQSYLSSLVKRTFSLNKFQKSMLNLYNTL